MSANHRYETLSELVGAGNNVLAVCRCGHRGVLDGRLLSRLFFVRRWDGRKHMIGARLRCSICAARPVTVAPTFAAASSRWNGPTSEAEWKRLVARLRG